MLRRKSVSRRGSSLHSFGPLSILTAGFDQRVTELEEYARRQATISQERQQPSANEPTLKSKH